MVFSSAEAKETPNADFSGSSDGVVQLDIIWVDILVVTAGSTTVHNELSHL